VAALASSEVTLVLRRLGSAEDASDRSAAASRLLELLYGELRRIAARLMRRERPGQTLQPTALVHEVYMRLVDQPGMQWSDRAHFLGVAARAMRQILVDQARRRAAQRRGGGLRRVTLDEEAASDGGRELELLELHQAMERLASLDERAARVAEMRLFGGMTVAEIAHVLGVSPRTVDDDWAVAKAWLRRELAGEATT
jgi:RNA polymerase sigma factor (TIGR02999 family)